MRKRFYLEVEEDLIDRTSVAPAYIDSRTFLSMSLMRDPRSQLVLNSPSVQVGEDLKSGEQCSPLYRLEHV